MIGEEKQSKFQNINTNICEIIKDEFRINFR